MVVSAQKSLTKNTFNLLPQLQEQYDNIRLIEPLITDDLCSLSDYLHTTWQGLEYAVKTPDSIEDKVARTAEKTGEEPGTIFSQLRDVIRYTQICPAEDITKVTNDTISFLNDRGYKLSALTNYYKNPFPNTGYKGMHLNFISPYGKVFELQIHSEHSFAIKQGGHDLYEQMRSISTPIEIKEKLAPQIRELHKQVPNPPGIIDICNFKMSNNEINEYINTLATTDINIGKQERNGINVMVFNISQNSKNIFSGSEIRFSDSSITINRQYPGNHLCQLNITDKGMLTNKVEREGELSISTKKVMIEAIKTEEAAKEWMSNYLGEPETNKRMANVLNELSEKYNIPAKDLQNMLIKNMIHAKEKETPPQVVTKKIIRDEDYR